MCIRDRADMFTKNLSQDLLFKHKEDFLRLVKKEKEGEIESDESTD